MADVINLFNTFYSSLSHELRTPLSIIQNELLYLEKTKDLSNLDLIKKKIDLILSTLNKYKLAEISDEKKDISLGNLKEFEFFKNNSCFFSDEFNKFSLNAVKELVINLFTYFNIIVDKLELKEAVIEGDVADNKAIISITYELLNKNHTYKASENNSLALLIKDSLNIDLIEAVYFDLLLIQIGFSAEFEISKSLNCKIILE